MSAHGRTLSERFFARIDTIDPDVCWEWRKSDRARFGYGRLRMFEDGRQVGRPMAHRVSWELFRGPIPDGMYVLHRCDNPPCVNPDHLFLGTKGDNNRDTFRKGRNLRVGERMEPSTRSVLVDALLYAERNLGRVQAIDPTTGEPCWAVVHRAIEQLAEAETAR